jgi:TadE-like protein
MRLRFLRDRSGAAMVEFALVVPTFIYLMFGALQFAYIIIISSIMESAMFDATRLAKVSDNSATTVAAIRQAIQTQSMGLLNANEVLITTNLSANLADSWQNAPAEQCTDAAGVPIAGSFCPCSIGWLDANNDGECDVGPPPLALQAPGNIVNFMAFYKFRPFIPSFGLVPTINGRSVIVATTTVRNEPAP